MRWLSGVLSVLAPFLLFGQSKGEVKLHVSPYRGLEYILDGKERLNSPALVLPAGEHRFVFWAPDRSMFDTTITFIADTTIAFYKVLQVTPEFRAFDDQMRRLKHGRFFYRAVPILATAVGAVFTVNGIKKNNEAYDALIGAEEGYADLRSGFTAYKQRKLPELQKDLDRSNTRLGIAIGATAVAAAATIYGFIKAASLKDPSYEDKEKLKFDGLVWMPGQQGGSLQCGFTLAIR